ncbi:MAG: glycosyltransferase [Flavobacteriaceae bacterium]|nr:glycosyltransferase [Bacteroidia bacterium]NNK88020.1 glycosyltransferase [Flavobacteriaceae bacterium]
MKSRLKIAIYSGAIPSTTFIEHLIHEVAKHHEVLLFGNIKETPSYANKNIKIISTPYSKWQYIPLTLWRMMRLLFTHPGRIAAAYKRAKEYPTTYLKVIRFTRYIAVLLYAPDIFHLQWVRRIERWTFLKDVYDCKIMLSLLGTQITIAPENDPALAKAYSDHFPRVDEFNAVCSYTAGLSLKYGADQNRVQIRRIPISSGAFERFRIPGPIDGNPLRIVSVGRFDWVKGYRYGIDAIKILTDKGISVEYTIIAQGEQQEELLFQVHQLGLTDIVKFKPGLDQETLFPELQHHDALLLPSVSEGISNAAVECMALGIPVVGANCGGMNEIIINGESGWLVPVRNPQAFAEALENLLGTTPEDMESIIRRANQIARDQFNMSDRVDEFVRSYEQLANHVIS